MADPLRTLSLDALRGFEAAARHLSFTAAAEALSLSQSAVSKQVKLVEHALGKPLFTRGARGLALTPEGRQLQAGMRDCLSRLQALVEQVAQPDRRRVSVSATPSFASLWLAPRLADWREGHPDVDLHLDASEADLSLEREGIDLAIRLAAPERANAGWTLLARERAVLVAAPALAARLRQAADLATAPLLAFHHPVTRCRALSWPCWHEHLGVRRDAAQPVLHFSQYEHLLKAAVAGAGVAIGRLPLVSPLLHDQQLQVLWPEHAMEGLGYWLVMAEPGAARDDVRAVAGWIGQQLA